MGINAKSCAWVNRKINGVSSEGNSLVVLMNEPRKLNLSPWGDGATKK